jgi:hypothetical protein
MKRMPVGIVIVGLILCSHVLAADPAAPPAAPSGATIRAGDKDALQANMGKDAIVEGEVADAQWSGTGRVFIIKFKDADDSHFQGALLSQHKEAVEKGFDGDLVKALAGAKIRLSGKLQAYREHPEILIEAPEQITIVEKGTPEAAAAAQTAAARISEQAKTPLFGAYANLKVTDEQRAKIAAIQKESHEQELAMEQKLRDEQDAKIAPLLTDEQKEQLKQLKEAAKNRSRTNGGDTD